MATGIDAYLAPLKRNQALLPEQRRSFGEDAQLSPLGFVYEQGSGCLSRAEQDKQFKRNHPERFQP